ncbi:hypothetical protein I3842_11G074400 [Carya illinoinensis]|uniref:Uncharacterized protein n=1 Tax=Carya illinoinensis TaxID=32201 RepID=A0A922DNX6_CARIL|nr:hypothetical protein I3842_11G074400 [Carya illinoinensis]
MRPSSPYTAKPVRPPPTPTPSVFTQNFSFNLNVKRSSVFRPRNARFAVTMTPSSGHSSSPVIESDIGSHSSMIRNTPGKSEAVEEGIERAIYRCRFMALLGVLGSLVGSILCFIKGCTYVVSSYLEYSVNRGKVIMLLVESIDVYLLGTVMLVFGMGLYELFVSNLDTVKSPLKEKLPYRSNLFGLFTLKERPKWLNIKTVNELKTKLGHVIVMLLLIGLFEKSKKAVIQSPVDLLCFSASVLLSSGSLFLLSKLTDQTDCQT